MQLVQLGCCYFVAMGRYGTTSGIHFIESNRLKLVQKNLHHVISTSIFYTYHAFISLKSDKCLPFIFIG